MEFDLGSLFIHETISIVSCQLSFDDQRQDRVDHQID